jgi:hypothetical protein
MIDDSNKQSQLILENTKKLIKSFNKSLNLFEKGALGVLLGKNNIQRGSNAGEMLTEARKKKDEVRALNNIIVAKEQGKDIHRDELKSDKLEITGGRYGDLAQAIVDEEDSSNEN